MSRLPTAVLIGGAILLLAWLLTGRRRLGRRPEGWSRAPIVSLGSRRTEAIGRYTLERLRQAGIRIPANNRLERAVRLLNDANTGRKVLAGTDTGLLQRVTAAQWTIMEQFTIASALIKDDGSIPAGTKHSLELMLGGPDTPDVERKPLARNIQFELYTASLLMLGGFPVRFAEPDVRIFLNGEDVGVACKRVRGDRGVKDRTKEAVHQIRRAGGRGIVAVNVDLLIQDHGLAGSTAERGAAFDRRLAKLHQLDEELMHAPEVLGRIALGHVAVWHLDQDPPRLEMGAFRQFRFFPGNDAEEAAINEIFARF